LNQVNSGCSIAWQIGPQDIIPQALPQLASFPKQRMKMQRLKKFGRAILPVADVQNSALGSKPFELQYPLIPVKQVKKRNSIRFGALPNGASELQTPVLKSTSHKTH
jgi:hypothetical protein